MIGQDPVRVGSCTGIHGLTFGKDIEVGDVTSAATAFDLGAAVATGTEIPTDTRCRRRVFGETTAGTGLVAGAHRLVGRLQTDRRGAKGTNLIPNTHPLDTGDDEVTDWFRRRGDSADGGEASVD